MNPDYQQMMVQALMGQQNMAPGMAGQNASTPYGAGFITGNQSMPTQFNPYGQGAGQGGGQAPGMFGSQPAAQQLNPGNPYGG